MDKHFKITDLGEIHYILGLQIKCNCKNHFLYLNQSFYIDSILEQFGMGSCHPVSTSLVTNHNLSLLQCPKTKDEQEEYNQYSEEINYLSLIGSLLYATQTRPDIQFAVNLLTQFSNNLGIPHLAACKQILRYLKGTKFYCLKLGNLFSNEPCLVGWSDTNWAQNNYNRRSISG